MKKSLIIIKILLLIVLCLTILTGCKEEVKTGNTSDGSSSGTTTYEWPGSALDKYDIPKLDSGKIVDLNEAKNEGYDFNYTMEVKEIKKSDLDSYCKKFEGWDVYKTDSAYFFTRSDLKRKSSAVITLDEEKGMAKIVITVSNAQE